MPVKKKVGVAEFKKNCKGKEPIIVLYHMTTCGHCIALRPAWNDAVKDAVNVKIAEIESAQMFDLPAQLQVSMFPTIVVVQEGRFIDEYHGDRTKQSLHIFMSKYAKAPAPKKKVVKKK